jgi:acetyltransferase
MIASLRSGRLLGAFRGEPPVDRDELAAILVGLGRLAVERPDVASVDVNPLVVRAGARVAVDALVEVGAAPVPAGRPLDDAATLRARFAALFHPRGIIVAGASSHPGKFGFAAFHNLLRFGYRGALFGVNREGAEVLGHATLREVAEVPDGAATWCSSARRRRRMRRCCATAPRAGARRVRGQRWLRRIRRRGEAARGRARRDGRRVRHPARGPERSGPRLDGRVDVRADRRTLSARRPHLDREPERQPALVPAELCDADERRRVESGVGRQLRADDRRRLPAYFAADDETAVALTYLEGVRDGRRLLEAFRRVTARKPLVVLKGGASASGQRAAASHTGALASDDRVFDGLCRQTGALRAATVEEAFDWAATFATQPPARGPARRRADDGRRLGRAHGGRRRRRRPRSRPAARRPAHGDRPARAVALEPRQSDRPRGGETRDTLPAVLDLVTRHPDVDAVLFLGLGIQANQAWQLRSGPYFTTHGLDRIVEFHERQDRRYAEAAREVSERYAKPVLVATELAYADRWYGAGNPGPLAVREGGRVCYPSGPRAVAALAALVTHARRRAS